MLFQGRLFPRGLIAAIVGITVVPLGTLLWLGWRLLDQDRILEGQQAQDRLERTADLAVAALQRAIASSEQRLERSAADWPGGAVVLSFHENGVEAHPKGRVAYLPVTLALPEAPASAFAEGEALEFRQHDRAAAIRQFRDLAKAPDPAIRAGALLRLARNLKSSGQTEEALAAYERLANIDGVSAGGVPAGLAARYARCKLFEDAGRAAELRGESARLAAELRAGRWPLTAPVYWLYARDAAKWTGDESRGPLQAEIFAGAAAALWEKRNQAPGPGRETLRIDGQMLTVLRQSSGGGFRALVAAPAFVESQWLAAAPVARQQRIRMDLNPPATAPGGARRALRSLADTGLPWSVAVSSADPSAPDREFVLRRRLLIAGFGLLVAMALAASYLIFRAVSRELAVARLQSDFVAAVSHEFRTPLTTLRQFTDMLRDNAGVNEERRRLCYEAQSRATDRLTRLVESLLDFGRMEAGSRPYRLEPRDCTELVRRTVEEFRGNAQAAGYAIEFHGNGSAEIDADEEALARAVWNLLENAVKYSPGGDAVDTAVERRDGAVHIAVRDHGIGIPPHEQAAIFRRFQRGEQARKLGIKGTGIGLAMVDQIVKAHRGRVDLKSRPGEGSTFTIVLPVKEG